ncbi:MAG: hypothetical protein ACYC0H_18905, partial [Solirubrobacteraceae bacterium]
MDPAPQRGGAGGSSDGIAGGRRAPVLLNRRAAARPTITGVERYSGEVIARLAALAPDRYRVVAPPARLRRS